MTKYVIHGRSASGEVVEKVFEAGSGAEARAMAEGIGLEVVAVEVVGDHRSPGAGGAGGGGDPFSTPTPDDPRDAPERETWRGTPSQWVNFWWFVSCVLIVPIPWALWKWLSVRATEFTVTSQRIKTKSGVLNQRVEEIELYRVKDTELSRSFFERLVGLGTVAVISSDDTTPRLEMPAVPDAEGLREAVRASVEAVRRARGVRELDVS